MKKFLLWCMEPKNAKTCQVSKQSDQTEYGLYVALSEDIYPCLLYQTNSSHHRSHTTEDRFSKADIQNQTRKVLC